MPDATELALDYVRGSYKRRLSALQASASSELTLTAQAIDLTLLYAPPVTSRRDVNKLLTGIARSRVATFNAVDALSRQGLTALGEEAAATLARDLVSLAVTRGSLEPVVAVSDWLKKEYMVGTTYEEWFAKLRNSDYLAIRARLRMGLVMKQTNLEVLQAIKGTQANNYRDGELQKTKNRISSMLATAANLVTNLARFEVMKAANITQWGYASQLDGDTSEQCTANNGEVYRVGEGPRPPLHIGCRAIVVPVIG